MRVHWCRSYDTANSLGCRLQVFSQYTEAYVYVAPPTTRDSEGKVVPTSALAVSEAGGTDAVWL